jgi:nanoRNase/pAp phosphatase (c-di-AMP/oligoRNAs hydrolase)
MFELEVALGITSIQDLPTVVVDGDVWAFAYGLPQRNDVIDEFFKVSDVDAVAHMSPGSKGIAFRSRNDGPARTMARRFDGGGHPRAAGGRLEALKDVYNVDDAVNLMMMVLKPYRFQ